MQKKRAELIEKKAKFDQIKGERAAAKLDSDVRSAVIEKLEATVTEPELRDVNRRLGRRRPRRRRRRDRWRGRRTRLPAPYCVRSPRE